LRDLSEFEIARNFGAIGRTKAIGKDTLARVAPRSGIGIFIHGTSDFVGAVLTVGLAVAKDELVDTFAIAALELTVGTHGLARMKVGTNVLGLGQAIAVFDLVCPVASLSVEIEYETGRTSYGREGVSSFEVVGDASDGVATI